jgi:hypothetical protein
MDSLIKRLDPEILNALKAHDSKKAGVLRLLKSALHDEEIIKRAELTSEDEIKIVRKEVKKRLDAIEKFKAGNRLDLAEVEEYEINCFKEYLPAEMSAEELRIIVEQVVKENSEVKDFGKIMKLAMERLGGRAGGDKVAGIIKELLK